MLTGAVRLQAGSKEKGGKVKREGGCIRTQGREQVFLKAPWQVLPVIQRFGSWCSAFLKMAGAQVLPPSCSRTTQSPPCYSLTARTGHLAGRGSHRDVEGTDIFSS